MPMTQHTGADQALVGEPEVVERLLGPADARLADFFVSLY